MTPAGDVLAAANLFTGQELVALGALRRCCSNIRYGSQRCDGLPGHYAEATWLKTMDLRLNWPFQVGERVMIEPNVSFFNVFQFREFRRRGESAQRHAERRAGKFVE